MKGLCLLFAAVIFFGLQSCNSCTSQDQEYEAATFMGARKAYLDGVDKKVQAIKKNLREMRRYEFDSVDHHLLSTEYAYWQKVHIYTDRIGIRKAKFYADPEKSALSEEFYFDEERNLIFATINKNGLVVNSTPDNAPGEKLYFVSGQLVYALDHNQAEMNVKDKKVKLKAIDLLNESTQIKEIMSNKKLTP